MFFRVFIGLIAISGAFLLIRFRFQLREFFGPLSLLDRFCGSTENGLVVIAILIFLWSLTYMTGTFNVVMQNTFGKFF